MRNTKGVLPVTGIVPPITKTMHRSFTDSIVPVTRIIFLVGDRVAPNNSIIRNSRIVVTE